LIHSTFTDTALTSAFSPKRPTDTVALYRAHP